MEMRGIEPRSDNRTLSLPTPCVVCWPCGGFLLPSISQTTDGGHIYSKSPLPALWLSRQSKSSKRRSASFQRREGVNGAAAHWLILARSSGSESELSAVRFSTYSFVWASTSGPYVLGTLPATNRSPSKPIIPILNYQSPVQDRTFQDIMECQ